MGPDTSVQQIKQQQKIAPNTFSRMVAAAAAVTINNFQAIFLRKKILFLFFPSFLRNIAIVNEEMFHFKLFFCSLL